MIGVGIWNSKGYTISGQVPSASSVFSGEGLAIFLAITHCMISSEQYVLLTDSLSVLQSLAHISRHSPRISLMVLNKLLQVHSEVRSITLIWVPAHTGIRENELADSLAKASLSKNLITSWIAPEDLERQFTSEILHTAEETWSWCKYATSYPERSFSLSYRKLLPNRESDVLFARLRTRSLPTKAQLHKCRLSPSPMCNYCAVPETVDHLVLECSWHSVARSILRTNIGSDDFSFSKIFDFKKNSSQKIKALLRFLKETGYL